MTSSKYSRRQIRLSSKQINKLTNGERIKLNKDKLWQSNGKKCDCDLTAQQIKKIRKSMMKRSGATLKFSKTQINHHIKAGGIWNSIKDKASELFNRGPREGATNRFMDFVSKHGNERIKYMTVGRTPVQKGVQKALNIITLGGYEAAKRQLKYDDVYHNFIVITLESGHKFRLEKNHVVEANSTSRDGQYAIPLPDPNLTLAVLIGRSSSNDPEFWKYDPVKNNCQLFVKNVLERNHLPIPQQAQDLVKPQNVEQLLAGLIGPLKKLPQFVTDLAGTFDRVIHGEGLNQ